MISFNQYRLSPLVLLVVFILWPFIACVLSLFQFEKKETRFIIWMFLLLFGYGFIIVSESIDANSYVQDFYRLGSVDAYGFIKSLIDKNTIDFFIPSITYGVSYLTENSRFLFLLFSGIFGFFMLKSAGLVFDSFGERDTNLAFIFMFLFLSLNPIFNINGIRMWLSVWLFFYLLCRYYACEEFGIKGCTIYLFGLTVLIHWSFLFLCILFFVYDRIKIKELYCYLLLLLSFFVSKLFTVYLVPAVSLIGGKFEEKGKDYTSEEAFKTMEMVNQNASAIFSFYKNYFPISFLLVVLYVRYLLWKKGLNNIMYNWFCFLILVYAFTNMFSGIMSFYRFFIVFQLLAVLYITNSLRYLEVRNILVYGICLFWGTMSFYKAWILGSLVTNIYLFYPMPYPLFMFSSFRM